MKKFLFKLNSGDSYEVDEIDFEIDLTSKASYKKTFYNKLRPLYRLPNFFQYEAIDLFNISLMVYYVDKKISRNSSYDNWTRSFKLYIPVLELDKWNSNKKHLEKVISFLSGDLWKFEFRKRKLNKKEIKIQSNIKNKYKYKKFNPQFFCMLSGGLDSFIGATDLLTHTREIGFVGLYGGGKGVKPFQDKVNNLLKEEYGLTGLEFFNFYAAPVKGVEDSTRTRSFLFFAHAIVLASSMQRKIDLYIPENGLISLNVPLTNTRLGSSSTRTTHPYYMDLLQGLLDNLGLSIILKNPYQFKTKGEMLKECSNQYFLMKNYKYTMSCSHPDQGRFSKLKEPKHCGTCLPCSIRRASVLYAFKSDKSKYRDSSFNGKDAKKELRSFKIGVKDFRKNKNGRFIIQSAGPIKNNFDNYNDLYKRGMNELGDFLDLHNE